MNIQKNIHKKLGQSGNLGHIFASEQDKETPKNPKKFINFLDSACIF